MGLAEELREVIDRLARSGSLTQNDLNDMKRIADKVSIIEDEAKFGSPSRPINAYSFSSRRQ